MVTETTTRTFIENVPVPNGRGGTQVVPVRVTVTKTTTSK